MIDERIRELAERVSEHHPLGPNEPVWCAYCSEGKLVAEWVPWPCPTILMCESAIREAVREERDRAEREIQSQLDVCNEGMTRSRNEHATFREWACAAERLKIALRFIREGA